METLLVGRLGSGSMLFMTVFTASVVVDRVDNVQLLIDVWDLLYNRRGIQTVRAQP